MKTNSTSTKRAKSLAAVLVAVLSGCGQSGPLVLPDRTPATAEAPQSETDAGDEDEAERER